MASVADHRIASMLMKQVYIAQKNWEWFFALGVVQVVAGMLAVGFASAALFASAVAIGVLLIAAGAQIAAALLTRDWGGLLLFLLLGVAYTAVGFLTLHSPLLATPGLIFILAPAYLVGGIARIILASFEQFPSWRWVRLNGIITILLGLAIWGQWSDSGQAVLGQFIGIDLVVNGLICSVLAVGLHAVARW